MCLPLAQRRSRPPVKQSTSNWLPMHVSGAALLQHSGAGGMLRVDSLPSTHWLARCKPYLATSLGDPGLSSKRVTAKMYHRRGHLNHHFLSLDWSFLFLPSWKPFPTSRNDMQPRVDVLQEVLSSSDETRSPYPLMVLRSRGRRKCLLSSSHVCIMWWWPLVRWSDPIYALAG